MKHCNLDESNGMEIGLYSLGDLQLDAHTGKTISQQERIQNIVQMTKLAEETGVDIFSLGEGHQKYFISQEHQVILGYIAAVISKIKITSGVTVLSTTDSVRVFEEFSTLDLLTNGRIELIPSRASRIGVYKLIGVNLKYNKAIFEEKFNLHLLLNSLLMLIDWRQNKMAMIHLSCRLQQPVSATQQMTQPLQ